MSVVSLAAINKKYLSAVSEQHSVILTTKSIGCSKDVEETKNHFFRKQEPVGAYPHIFTFSSHDARAVLLFTSRG